MIYTKSLCLFYCLLWVKIIHWWFEVKFILSYKISIKCPSQIFRHFSTKKTIILSTKSLVISPLENLNFRLTFLVPVNQVIKWVWTVLPCFHQVIKTRKCLELRHFVELKPKRKRKVSTCVTEWNRISLKESNLSEMPY